MGNPGYYGLEIKCCSKTPINFWYMTEFYRYVISALPIKEPTPVLFVNWQNVKDISTI